MFKHLRSLCNAVEEIEDGLIDVATNVLDAAGSDDLVVTRNPYGAKNMPYDLLKFLMGRQSHIGTQLNGISLMLNFLKYDVAFVVRHNRRHGQKGLPAFPADLV